MPSIVITKLHGKTVKGAKSGAKATITLSDGTQRQYDGKVSDGAVYNGGKLDTGVSVQSSNATGEFAWVIMDDSDVTLITNPAN